MASPHRPAGPSQLMSPRAAEQRPRLPLSHLFPRGAGLAGLPTPPWGSAFLTPRAFCGVHLRRHRGWCPHKMLWILPWEKGEPHDLMPLALPLWDSCNCDIYGVCNLACAWHWQRGGGSGKGTCLPGVSTPHGPCQGSWCCEEGKQEGRRAGR